jgi:hypothetical protein
MKKIQILLWVAALAFVSGCADHEFPTVAEEGDYLPTNQNERYFLREQFNHPDLSERRFYDTIRVAFAGDAVINDKTYQEFIFYSLWDSGSGIIEVNYPYLYFRKDGSRYLQPALHREDEEYVFLDTEKPVGSSWQYYGGFQKERKTIYTIKAVNATRRINGIDHNDVIEVEMETQARDYGGTGYYRVATTTRYFARGKGEIYSLFSFYGYTAAYRISSLE